MRQRSVVSACRIEPLEKRQLLSVLGVDAASYQYDLNWTTVKADGYVFGWEKATQGTYYVNSTYFGPNMTAAKAAGEDIGAYCFADYEDNPDQTASVFWNVLTASSSYLKADGLSLVPMLDCEQASNPTDVLSGYTVASWTAEWCKDITADIKTLTGFTVSPIIYTDSSFANDYFTSTTADNYPLWIAASNPSGSALSPWTSYEIWQYGEKTFPATTSTGTAESPSTDVDQLNGDSTELQNLIVGSGKFAINSAVQTTQSVTAYGNYNGSGTSHSVASGVIGSVLATPQYYNNAWFFDVSFTTGVSGWVNETALQTAPSGPVTPTNSSPSNGATVSTLTPTLTASAFTDGTAGRTQKAAEWLVYSGSTLVYDSGTDTTDLTSITIPSGKLNINTTYTWEVRYEDSANTWSSYSTATSFTIPAAGPLSLPAASAYYVENSANGSTLDVWDATTNVGTPSQTYNSSLITTIIINGASTGSNITIDFTNGSPAPQNRVTIFGNGSATNNTISVVGSASGNDSVTLNSGQYLINSTTVAFSDEGTTNFMPGAGTDSLTVNNGKLNLGTPASGYVYLSSLSIGSGDTLNIGGAIVNLAYTAGNDPESTIESLVDSAYNNNTWTGTGLTSSLAAANPAYSAVGYYDTGSSITIRATWRGDANCDGVINADDLSLMALGQAKSNTDWSAGNFNYDTQINADDWMIFNYAVAYSNGRNYTNVFGSSAVLESATQMDNLLA